MSISTWALLKYIFEESRLNGLAVKQLFEYSPRCRSDGPKKGS